MGARHGRGRVAGQVWLVVLGLVAAGCASGRGGGEADAPPGVLRIGLERPQTLDPALARFPADLLVVDQLFDGLTTYHPQTLAVRPALADRWEATPDQKRWRFFLKAEARFANGRQVTSADVKFSLERIARKDSPSPVAAQLEPVAGYRAFHTDGTSRELAGVSAPEPGVVDIQLSFPFAGFPVVLGHPSFGIVPREAVEAASPRFAEQPVGSGPFLIRSRSAEVLRLIPAQGTRTALKAVEFYMGADSLASYSAFVRGRLDWTAVPAERVSEVARDLGRDGFRPYPGELLYGFNLKNPKFADIRFREAIVRAINRPDIVRVAYGERARVLEGLVADGVPGFQPDACGEPCRFDPVRSRALLVEAFGSKAVPEVAIDYDDDPVQDAIAHFLAANLAAAGITTKLRPRTYTDYVRFAASGQQELFRLAWIGAYPSPDAFLTPLFYSGQADNVTRFSRPDVDALLAQARSEPDDGRRTAVYQQAERLILAQYAVIPLAQYETHTLVSSRVEGLVMTAFGTFDASKVRLSR